MPLNIHQPSSKPYLNGIVEMSGEAVFNEQGSEVKDAVDKLPEGCISGQVKGKMPGLLDCRLASLLQDGVKTVQDIYPVE